jgi:Tfp pilus assembly protein PilO
MIANLSGRVAAVLAGAAVIVVLLVGWFLLVSPQRSKAVDLSTKIDATQAQVESTQAYVDSPATKQAVHDLGRLQKVLPDNPKISQILRQLSAAAATSKVSLDTISPTTAIASSGGEAVPITLSVTGHYTNLSRFFHLLRSEVTLNGEKIKGSGRLFSVDSIQFSGGGQAAGTSPGEASSTSAPIAASIALNTFVYSAAPVVPVTPTDTTSTTSP